MSHTNHCNICYDEVEDHDNGIRELKEFVNEGDVYICIECLHKKLMPKSEDKYNYSYE